MITNTLTSWFRKIKLSYVGFALFIAYGFIYIHDAAPQVGNAGFDQTHLMWYLLVLFSTKCLTYIVCAIASFRKPLLDTTPLAIISSMLLAIGVVLVTLLLRVDAFSFGGQEAFTLLMISAASLGIGDALMILLWGRFISALSVQNTFIFMLVSYLLALIFYSLIAFLPPLLLALSTLIVCILLPFLTKKSIDQKPLSSLKQPRSDTMQNALSSIWRPVILTAAFAFMSNSILLISDQQSVDPFLAFITSTGITLAVVLALLVPALLIPEKFNIGVAYRFALPLAAGGLLLLSFLWNSGGGIANSMVAMGWFLTDLVAWCVVANAATEAKISPFFLFGIEQTVINCFAFGGIVTGYFFSQTVVFDTVAIMTAALIGIFILSTFITFLVKDRKLNGFSKQTDVSPVNSTSNPRDNFQEKINELIERGNLTRRESDVLRFLAQGRNTQYISESLFVSENTVKSHVRNIYQKLGVHSKQDIIDIINPD